MLFNIVVVVVVVVAAAAAVIIIISLSLCLTKVKSNLKPASMIDIAIVAIIKSNIKQQGY
jgi:hypothetical protein